MGLQGCESVTNMGQVGEMCTTLKKSTFKKCSFFFQEVQSGGITSNILGEINKGTLPQ